MLEKQEENKPQERKRTERVKRRAETNETQSGEIAQNTDKVKSWLFEKTNNYQSKPDQGN